MFSLGLYVYFSDVVSRLFFCEGSTGNLNVLGLNSNNLGQFFEILLFMCLGSGKPLHHITIYNQDNNLIHPISRISNYSSLNKL